MKRLLAGIFFCFALSVAVFAQEDDLNSPATREDIQKYFDAVHSRQMVDQMMAAMLKQIRQMTHDQYLKDKEKLPPDFEEHVNRHVEAMFKNMPWDDMMQAMMPAYQKHFTKGDIQALMTFYSSPTGQKMLRELPAIMGESMQAMTPIIEKYMESVKQQVNDEFAQALKQSRQKTN